ncbi:F-box only protein 42 isoform X2 [Latimeria chalumnae]|uniref:F-box only protein 42 isoform X2 n=1 Tax=Latimeria chalumnae TaxID=7897 RepID=UPI0006D901BC|nr:PREDICTED: F-box only protein 42 isoform X2 [Latimeria chalumnae]|eukprot:XP_014344012.1 PREDICTED: F-box only protein 42 isoform X2 [Latimeria chalumnae]
MASSSDSEDDSFIAMDTEEMHEGTMEQDDEPHVELEIEETRHNRSMSELPEEVLEYILSFLSPYQEHKTAALVCKQWYRLIKGVAHQCYHGFIKAVQEGNIQWESRTYPYPGTPITQRFSHSSYPSPKAGATLVVYKDLLVLFGGWTRPSPYPLHQPERFFDEIHTYSPSKNWWNCIVTTHGPPPMAGHSSSVIGDKMIVFGGSLGSRQMSNEVWVLDLEQWAWSKPNITCSTPHPRGGQSQIVIDDETILILGGCGGPNALFKDAWLLHMHSTPWIWQQLKVDNEEHGAPELWCHPACRVGQCVVVFSQAPSGRAPLSPSLNSRPSPISATPPALVPETREYRSQSPVRSSDEAPCVNGRWGTLRPRTQRQTASGSREGSLSPARGDSSPVLNGGSLSPGATAAAVGGSASLDSPVRVGSPSTPSAAEGYDFKAGILQVQRRGSLPEQSELRLGSAELHWDSKPTSSTNLGEGMDNRTTTGTARNPPEQTNGVHTPPHIASTPPGAVSPGALRRGLEAVKALSTQGASSLATVSSGAAATPGSPGSHGQSASSHEAVSAPRHGPAQGDSHSLPPIARRLGHHPPQSLNVGKPLYQSMNCKPMQMYVLDIKDAKKQGRVSWKVFSNTSVVGPPETSLHTVVQGRGELIIFGGLMDKKQNVKYYPKTNALYFVRAKR